MKHEETSMRRAEQNEVRTVAVFMAGVGIALNVHIQSKHEQVG